MSVAALGRCGQADDVPRLHLLQDALELDSWEVMALVDDDLTVLRDEIRDGVLANETLDHRDVDLSCRRSLGTPNLALDEAGFVGTLASNSEFEIVRYLRLGDVVSTTTVLEAVSPEKKTRIGPGHFVTWVTTYTDAAGEVVGRQRFRILKFRPNGAAS
jgi:hypothetical protein